MNWRVLINGKTHPYMNMAIDEAIYQCVSNNESPPTIRFYNWQPSSFSYGYNQIAEKELDLAKVKKSPYLYVRRPTGGRLVLHDDEVTYAVVAPLLEKMEGALTVAYLRISEALQKGFSFMSIEVDLTPMTLSRQEHRRSLNPCFSSSSQYEITYKKKKIVGSAQVRNNKAFLQHGSILIVNNQTIVADFLPNLSEEEKLRIKTFLSKKTTTVSSILNKNITYNEIVNEFVKGFQSKWAEDTFFFDGDLSRKENVLADMLFKNKYMSYDWNEKLNFAKRY